MNSVYYMKMALHLAEKGRGFTSPNPMVGAVVVKDGRIVGKGWHQMAGGPHAEVHALNDAGAAARDAVLYVTLEPCNHFGRTPPCTHKILEAGIRHVVMAMPDPNPDVAGGGMQFLQSKGIRVTSGVCEDEARRLNESFITFVQTGRPFVILKCAATLDGRIATRTGDSKWVTNEISRRFVHEIRHAVDGIMVGIGTVHSDNPSLTTRLKDKEGRDPVRIVLDTHLSIDEKARLLQLDSEADTLIICKHAALMDAGQIARKDRLQKKGIRVLETELKDGRIDLEAAIRKLGNLGITSLLIEGGSRVIASALAAGMVDKVCFFYAPRILGGDDGIPICQGAGPASMKDCIAVKDIHVRRFEEDIMIEGYINH
jgi:diaminohydroxyphosphoribosylaminopyrimidine deaminase/5-amino-6-(5-phosphoribosylamino)uracil reductase